MEKEKYYIIRKGSFVGNAIVFWREGAHGYTSDLDQAWLVSEEEGRDVVNNSGENDALIKQSVADKLSTRYVDMQNVDTKEYIGKEQLC